MRREIRDELIHGFLAVNAMLREETKALKRLIETSPTGFVVRSTFPANINPAVPVITVRPG